MAKTKLDHLNDLHAVCVKMDTKFSITDARVNALQKLAKLAKEGKKGTSEYVECERIYNFYKTTVTDFGDEVQELRKIVKYLSKYKS